MRRYRLLLLLLISFTFCNAYGQDNRDADSIAVMRIIQDVFDGMRAGDSSMISKHLLNGVIMHSVAVGKDGATHVSTDSHPEAWLKAVGTPKPQVLDERTLNYKLNLTKGLATVWMDYAFFIDDQFSHCGVNSFQLIKSMGNWKIIYIIDTRKKEDCNISAFLDTNN